VGCKWRVIACGASILSGVERAWWNYLSVFSFLGVLEGIFFFGLFGSRRFRVVGVQRTFRGKQTSRVRPVLSFWSTLTDRLGKWVPQARRCLEERRVLLHDSKTDDFIRSYLGQTRQAADQDHRFFATRAFGWRQRRRDLKQWWSMVEQGDNALVALFGGGSEPPKVADALESLR
jgi:hypothetical protein